MVPKFQIAITCFSRGLQESNSSKLSPIVVKATKVIYFQIKEFDINPENENCAVACLKRLLTTPHFHSVHKDNHAKRENFVTKQWLLPPLKM
jgi:hypothetical protein